MWELGGGGGGGERVLNLASMKYNIMVFAKHAIANNGCSVHSESYFHAAQFDDHYLH